MSGNKERLTPFTIPTPTEEQGFAYVANQNLKPHLPKEQEYRNSLELLLSNRENTQPNPDRGKALEMLWQLAFKAACFGTEINTTNGFSPFKFPPISSERLIELKIITDEQTIQQIEARQAMREKRGKGLPENRVAVKAAEKKEIENFGLQNIEAKSPILIITERYTVTLPEDPSVELDRIGIFAFFKDSQGNCHLLFLGEKQEPHAHAYAAGRWWRIDENSHPDFKIPQGIPLPPAKTVYQPEATTNDQIATLLALMVEGVKEAQKIISERK